MCRSPLLSRDRSCWRVSLGTRGLSDAPLLRARTPTSCSPACCMGDLLERGEGKGWGREGEGEEEGKGEGGGGGGESGV